MKLTPAVAFSLFVMLTFVSHSNFAKQSMGLDQSSIARIFDHHSGKNPDLGRTARVMSRIDPTFETHDEAFEEVHCKPSKNWNPRLEWRNGYCFEQSGTENRYIERANEWNQVLYFKCSNEGIAAKTWQSKYNPRPFGELDLDAVSEIATRVVLNGREVGTFPGTLPNTYVLSDLRNT